MSIIVRKPILKVIGPTGRNLVSRWRDQLLGVSITDQEGYESDECVIRLVGNPPYDRPPPLKTKYTILVGYANDGLTTMGSYEYQTYRKLGSPDEGNEMHIVCRAADFVDKMKNADSAHFDEENGFGTAGKIFEHLAKQAGTSANIDPEIAKIKIPYRLQHRQSAIDFATDLADGIGGIVKPQMGRLVVRKRGAGKSPSGGSLPTLNIPFNPSYGYEVELEPRPGYKQVDAQHLDPKKGRPKEQKKETNMPAARLALMHPYASEGEAKTAAAASAAEHARFTGTGSFEMAGTAIAVGGAPAKCSGFGADIDGVKWEVATASHEISPEEGWITSVETQTRENKSGA